MTAQHDTPAPAAPRDLTTTQRAALAELNRLGRLDVAGREYSSRFPGEAPRFPRETLAVLVNGGYATWGPWFLDTPPSRVMPIAQAPDAAREVPDDTLAELVELRALVAEHDVTFARLRSATTNSNLEHALWSTKCIASSAVDGGFVAPTRAESARMALAVEQVISAAIDGPGGRHRG